VAALVRSWNVFHGNVQPPDHRSHLHAMMRLATADRPDVLCLQEVPPWALQRLERWSGMHARWAVTRRPRLPLWLAGFLTRLHNGLIRSAIGGQANAILLAPELEPLEHRALRIDVGRPEPRWCHAVRTRELVVANLHASNEFRDHEVPAAEIRRAEAFVAGLADGLPCVLAGDFNLRAGELDPLPGWTELGAGIDHVLVRGLDTTPLATWPEDRRRRDGRLLSDHAPVEVTVG
jgi:endonuclease/exonuclease/phosphatase family metal-dependent hydrolase